MAASNVTPFPNQPWHAELIPNKDGKGFRAVLANIMTVLRQDRAIAGAVAHDELTLCSMAVRPLPWDMTISAPRLWTENDDRALTEWLQRSGLYVGTLLVSSAVQSAAQENKYHPVKQYLESIEEWDDSQYDADALDKPLDTWASDFLGCTDTPYTRAVAARWMISAVARIYEPGCKVDTALVLEGDQGVGKSSALRILGDPWFTDELAAMGTKDASEQTIGVWIVELSELEAATRAADVAHVKAFMSRPTDRFRLPYGMRTGRYPRQCVFAATTNSQNWNRDDTGGRRWWPLVCPLISLNSLEKHRDQLWSEALFRYNKKKEWHLREANLVKLAIAEQTKRTPDDPFEDPVADIVENLSANVTISCGEILSRMGIPKAQQTIPEAMRVGKILRRQGWVRKQHREAGGREWRYERET